jgi:glutathione S-transferase/GST-like protein
MGAHEHHEPAFLAINPDGTIPAVVHDGFTMTESTPAMEYIDDAFAGPPLRPADPYWRWRMRLVMRRVDNELAPALAMIASSRQAAPPFAGRDPAGLQTSAADLAESARRISEGIRWFEQLLDEAEWLAGPEFSLADICTIATFYDLPASYPDEVNDEAAPGVMHWLRRCHARPGIQAGFAIGRGLIAQRVADIRAQLGVEAVAA